MPHIRLEISKNLLEKNQIRSLIPSIHNTIISMISANLVECKTRVIEMDEVCIGDMKDEATLIHMELKIMKGRTMEKKHNLCVELEKILSTFFKESKAKLNAKISLELMELTDFYYKS